MAENKNFVINVKGSEGVNISEEVVGIIAGLGAAEVGTGAALGIGRGVVDG